MIRKYFAAAAAAGALTLAAASLCSCKGRTAENMEPTGETIEVVIDTPDSVADMPAAPAATDPAANAAPADSADFGI